MVTVEQLRKLDTRFLPAGFNVELKRTINELNGIPCKTWDDVRADKLQIFSTRSMGKRIVDAQDLNQALAKHASIAAIKAREQKSLCGTLMLFAANSPFDDTPCSYKVIKQFTTPTNDTSQILKVISENMHYLYKSGVAYYRVGVGLLDLSSEANQQGDLFNPSKDNVQLMGVIDSINQRYGSCSLFFAAQGIDEPWSMRRELLTPQYTTNWRHLPKFSC